MNGKLKFPLGLLLIALLSLYSKAAIVPPTASLTTAPDSAQSNPFQQKILAMLGRGSANSMMLLQNPQYAGILQLLNQIPSQVVAQFLQQYSRGVLDPQPGGYNSSINFTNWGDTVSTAYENILYPSSIPYTSGKQISSIQQFINSASRQGKRVRGAGLRHSWSNIFADPNQYLVSFYPFDVIEGTSDVIEYYANAMTQLQSAVAHLNIEHIAQIRKVGEISSLIQIDGKLDVSVRKHLVKVGAGVSNQQLRQWSIANSYQYRTSVLMVEMNFVGTISTCSHGSGKAVQTIADMVYELEFIDFNGNRQAISKRDNPQLIKSAIGSLGLLGVTIFVTIEMQDLEVVLTNPVNSYKDFTLPWPKDYPADKIQKRLQRPEYKAWLQSNNGSALPSWNDNFEGFKNALNQTYAEWFYFPIQGVHVLQNTWNTYGKKTPQLIEKIRKDNGMYIEDYPPETVKTFSKFSQFLSNYLAKDQRTLGIALALFKSPFAFMPQPNLFIDYPNALHFQRGAQNTMLRNFQLEINVPTSNYNGSLVPDYDLIQRIWWAGMEVAEEFADVVNIALEMRFFKGSDATLAPEYGYDYVCSIEFIRSKVLNATSEAQWRRVVVKMLSAFRALKDADGKQLIIRPHWGKEWDAIPEVKSFLLQDQGLKENIHKFLKDYKEIAKLKNFSYERNIYTFSNAIYRQILNNAITDPQDKIK